MEFTSSFDMSLASKLNLPITKKYGGITTTLSRLDGDSVESHIESIIGSMWDFSVDSELPSLTREYYYDVVIMRFANVLEKNSKTVILMDGVNRRFFISFSSTHPFTKDEVLTHFNLDLVDELDNYKYTDGILNDVQRYALTNKPAPYWSTYESIDGTFDKSKGL